MPDGVMLWFDEASGEGRVGRAGREYTALAKDIEAGARRPGARVHFDIHRERAVDTAVAVELREGTRTSKHHRRFGNLSGAKRPDTKGPAPVDNPHVEHGLALAGHPLAVAGAWARWLADGDVDHALKLYTPDATLHHDGVTVSGRSPLKAALEAFPVRGTGRESKVRGDGDIVLVRWEADTPREVAFDVRCRVAHGQIVEQWTQAARPPATATIAVTPSGPVVVDVLTKGSVAADAVEYGRNRILMVTELVDEPVLAIRIKLERAADPARARPALAEAVLDVNGCVVRAHVAARGMHEAIDLLQQRLRDKLHHLAEHRKAERHLHLPADEGEWRHGDLPTSRPEYFDRPVDERELVRHKAFVADELTVEEAEFDMEQLDHDFLLYRDLATGQDSLLERREEGTVAVHDLEHAPELTVAEALERLRSGGEPFVFFADATTGRGEVVYRRYDGHDGLITLDG